MNVKNANSGEVERVNNFTGGTAEQYAYDNATASKSPNPEGPDMVKQGVAIVGLEQMGKYGSGEPLTKSPTNLKLPH